MSQYCGTTSISVMVKRARVLHLSCIVDCRLTPLVFPLHFSLPWLNLDSSLADTSVTSLITLPCTRAMADQRLSMSLHWETHTAQSNWAGHSRPSLRRCSMFWNSQRAISTATMNIESGPKPSSPHLSLLTIALPKIFLASLAESWLGNKAVRLTAHARRLVARNELSSCPSSLPPPPSLRKRFSNFPSFFQTNQLLLAFQCQWQYILTLRIFAESKGQTCHGERPLPEDLRIPEFSNPWLKSLAYECSSRSLKMFLGFQKTIMECFNSTSTCSSVQEMMMWWDFCFKVHGCGKS